jgi:O-antigen ligase
MDRGATLVALLIWPACLGLWRQGYRRTCLGLGLAALPAMVLSYALAAKVALVAGAGCVALVLLLPRSGVRLLLVGVVGTLLLAPLAASRLPAPEDSIKWPGMLLSVHHRMTIWSFAADRIAVQPLTGWGFEASRTIGGKEELRVARPDGAVYSEALMPLHPHNAPLQVWLELGGLGAGLLAMFLAASMLRLLRGAEGLARAYQAAGFAAGAVISTVSFGFWQSWWQCSLWLCAALLAAQSRRS